MLGIEIEHMCVGSRDYLVQFSGLLQGELIDFAVKDVDALRFEPFTSLRRERGDERESAVVDICRMPSAAVNLRKHEKTKRTGIESLQDVRSADHNWHHGWNIQPGWCCAFQAQLRAQEPIPSFSDPVSLFALFFLFGCSKITKPVGLRLNDFDVIATCFLVDGIALGRYRIAV